MKRSVYFPLEPLRTYVPERVCTFTHTHEHMHRVQPIKKKKFLSPAFQISICAMLWEMWLIWWEIQATCLYGACSEHVCLEAGRHVCMHTLLFVCGAMVLLHN